MMMIGVLGVNHKSADLPSRERLARVCDRRFGPGKSPNCVLLSTCNRTEIYFSSEDLAVTHSHILKTLRYDIEGEFEHKLYSYFGFDCFTHLCRVATGMDSAVLAETEIQGQVKSAYENAANAQLLVKELHFLFQKSLKISKEARSSLYLSRGMPSLEGAVFQVISSYFEQEKLKRILFIGASDINKKICKSLQIKGISDITICNRSEEKIRAMASSVKVLHWKDRRSWIDYDVVIAGTKCPDYLLREEDAYAFSHKQLLIDLSVPRNIDPLLSANKYMTLLNIDQINQIVDRKKESKLLELERVGNLIFNAVEMQMKLFLQKEHVRVIRLHGQIC